MRALLLLAPLLLAACNRADPPAPEQASAEIGLTVFAGAGRDLLCVRQERGGVAAFITFAEQGDSNCMVRGTFDAGARAIIPNGDAACKIPLEITPNGAKLGATSPACAYYCGPKASFANKSFAATPPRNKAVDLAGDPLC